MKHYIDNNVLCPYYQHEDPRMIYCRGDDDDMMIHCAFAEADKAKEHKQIYCKGRWENCMIAKMMMLAEAYDFKNCAFRDGHCHECKACKRFYCKTEGKCAFFQTRAERAQRDALYGAYVPVVGRKKGDKR